MTSLTQKAADPDSGQYVFGWKLDRDQRRLLLRQFPPRFRNVDADHVTYKGKGGEDSSPPESIEAAIIGRADDGEGVEAMVVSIDGTTERPDGSTWHITWSLAEGRRAQESNDLLAARPWERFDLPMPIRLEPARFPRT